MKKILAAGMSLAAVSAFALPASASTVQQDELERGNEDVEVAYEDLSDGQLESAVTALERLRVENPGDPAVLINLGSAYSELGELEKASEAYRAAIESDVRYRLELADGEWIDSRMAARRALAALEGRMVAMQ